MKSRFYVKLDTDMYNFLKYKNQSIRGVSTLIEHYIANNIEFREDFKTFLSLPKLKPKMVSDWEKRNDTNKNKNKKRGNKK